MCKNLLTTALKKKYNTRGPLGITISESLYIKPTSLATNSEPKEKIVSFQKTLVVRTFIFGVLSLFATSICFAQSSAPTPR